MAAETVGSFDQITNALKNVYSSKVVEPMVNEETPFRRSLDKGIPAGGRVNEGIVKFGGNLAPPQAVAQIADGGQLPPARNRSDVQFTLNPTLFAGALQVGFITQAAFNTGKSAWNGGEVRRRTEEVIADTAKFIESTYVGTTGAGWRAVVQSDGTSNFVAQQPEGVRLLRENMYISVRTTAGGNTVRDSCDGRTISAIAPSTRTVTYSNTDQTLVAGDYVHVVAETSQTFSAYGATSIGTFANGLRGLIDDGTYLRYLHGLDRSETSTYNGAKLKANVFSNSGTVRNLTEQLLIRAFHQVRERTGKRVDEIWMGEGQVEKYIEFVAPDRRLPRSGKADTGNMATGYKGDELVHYAPGVEAKMNVSFDMIPRELFGLCKETFFHYVAKDLGFIDQGGMLKLVPATSSYKASLIGYVASVENIGCDMPLANFVIRDLADPLCSDVVA